MPQLDMWKGLVHRGKRSLLYGDFMPSYVGTDVEFWLCSLSHGDHV